MVKFIKHVKVYSFSELSEEAKEEAKRWYLNDETRCEDLTLDFESDIGCVFPNSDLNVQWALNSCQGDGVNIYGSVNLDDILTLPGSGRAPEFDWSQGYLSEKEIRTIRSYMAAYKDSVDIPMNKSYAYCIADRIDLAEDFRYELEDMGFRDIKIEVLEKAEKLVKQIFHQLCMQFEKAGYKHLYEISDEEMEENCNANEYYFYEDGSWFNEDKITELEELKEYWDNDGCLYRDLDRDCSCDSFEEEIEEPVGRYEVIFDCMENRYYCFIDAVSLEAAMFTFFKYHPHITYDMIVDHMEI